MATDNLTALETWCAPLLAKLSAPQRRTLTRTLATQLRRSQVQRITAQKNPDGSGYAPRKKQAARKKKGRIKQRPMFIRLRTAKYLRTKTTADAATIEFVDGVQRIARIHQEGGTDRVTPKGQRIRYAQRQLLGFSDADERLVRDLLIEHLSPR